MLLLAVLLGAMLINPGRRRHLDKHTCRPALRGRRVSIGPTGNASVAPNQTNLRRSSPDAQ
jgi:hypothetical protein